MTTPSTLTALSALARVTLRRTLRRKTLWVAAGLAVCPTVFANLMHGRSVISDVDDAFNVAKTLLAILPALFVASSIGEEIEDRTATYLWSRPVARWTVVIGKLLALAPIVMAFMVASWVLASAVAFHGAFIVEPAIALAAGALAVAVASAGIASLVPRHGMALAIIYVLADLFIGALPTSLNKLSMTFHAGMLWQADADKLTSGLSLAAIALVWLAAGLRRVRRLEV